MNTLIKNLGMTLAGLATAFLTAAILAFVEIKFGLAAYSLMFWFVVPVGALLSGFVAAFGYYLAVKYNNYRPTKLLLINMLMISLLTFFLIHYIKYSTLQIDGKPVSSYVSFVQYLNISITSTSMEFRFQGHNSETGEVGSFGYVIALLQIVGFSIGGLAVYLCLASLPYCDKCSRYFKKVGQQIRYFSDGEVLKNHFTAVLTTLSEKQFQTALETHAAAGGKKRDSSDYLAFKIELRKCEKCGVNLMSVVLMKLKNNGWDEIEDTKQNIFTNNQLSLIQS